jgi:hypothetical protein
VVSSKGNGYFFAPKKEGADPTSTQQLWRNCYSEEWLYQIQLPEEATDNMDLLMRFMASNRVGDTADPKNFFGVSQYVPSNHPTNGREGVDRKNSPRPADHSGAQRRWVIARGASRGDPRDHVTSQFDTSQARQRSGEELSEVDS